MKIAAIVFGILLLISCNNHSGSATTTDSIPIHTTETNKGDGGANDGLGDTNTINRTMDRVTHDTLNKK